MSINSSQNIKKNKYLFSLSLHMTCPKVIVVVTNLISYICRNLDLRYALQSWKNHIFKIIDYSDYPECSWLLTPTEDLNPMVRVIAEEREREKEKGEVLKHQTLQVPMLKWYFLPHSLCFSPNMESQTELLGLFYLNCEAKT